MTSNRPKALVTGASSGIGAATAGGAARRGMAVAVHYFNNDEGGRRTARAICDAGGEAFAIKADMRQQSDVQRMVAEVLKEFETLDVLVNNAGSMVGRVPFLDMTDDYWNDVFRLNVSSVFYCTQAVARQMTKQKSGVIINVSSIAGRNGRGGGGNWHGAAQAAGLQLTQ